MRTDILVAYATNSGSTYDVAQRVAQCLSAAGFSVDMRAVGAVESLDTYRAVVIGAPMILGWHGAAVRFLKRHRKALAARPWACFVMAISLTQPEKFEVDGVPVGVDRRLAQPPQKPGRLSWRERYASTQNYLRPILKAARPALPFSAGFFAGKVEFFRMKKYQIPLALLVTGGKVGDFRHWDEIEAWAERIGSELQMRLAGENALTSSQKNL